MKWTEEQRGGEGGPGPASGSWRGARARRWPGSGAVPALILGAMLLFGTLFVWHRIIHPFPTAPPAAPLPRQTPFAASFAQAQALYFRAQVTAKRQLEAVEEWDPDSIRGSMPELYRRSFIARAPEIGRAREAAREAVTRARTTDERYRATRLLAHIECDRGHHRAELALVKQLLALRPHDVTAGLMLARAAAEIGRPRPPATGAREKAPD